MGSGLRRFWDQFNANPELVNQGKEPGEPGYRTFDFRLNSSELAVLTTNGFVVSERLSSLSFADVYYNIWHNDLPVFVSTDAILQAWHRTYDAMLEEVEETYLFNGFESLLAEWQRGCRTPGRKPALACSRRAFLTPIISWQWPARSWPARQCPLLFRSKGGISTSRRRSTILRGNK